jgi:hypothetical protein
MLSETQIQALPAVACSGTAVAGTETMNEPGKLLEFRNLNRLQRRGRVSSLESALLGYHGHFSILPDAPSIFA